jgi:hypothetical protein
MNVMNSEPKPNRAVPVAEWTPPPVGLDKGAGHWSPPPVRFPTHRAGVKRQSLAVRIACLLFVFAAAALAVNRDKIPGWWAELFYRKPTQDWVRTVALKNLPSAVIPAKLSSFQIETISVTRESPGEANVAVTGTAIAQESLYEPVPLEDTAVGLHAQVQSLKDASERAVALRQRRRINISEPDLGGFAFVKETIVSGQTMHFEFNFNAKRSGSTWRANETEVNLIPSGKPIGSFPTNVAILKTDKANRQREDLISKIGSFVAAVTDAEKTTKDLPVLPPDEELPGERFPQTRMSLINPDELHNWSEQDVQYAINEIFARHGAEFQDNQVSMWFHQFSWYHPQPTLSFDQIEKWLPDVELQNVKSLGYVLLLKHQESEKKQEAAAAQQRAITAQRRAAAAQQQRAAAAHRAQQQAAERAQESAATAQAIGGIIRDIITSVPHR